MPARALRKRSRGIDDVQIGLEMIAERRAHRFGFALAQQAVVDEDARHLRADRLQQQRRRHRRIDAAGQAADDAMVADALAQLGHGLFDERADLPDARAAADVVEEVAQDLAAVRRVADFGMKLQADRSAGVRCRTAATGQVSVAASGDEIAARGRRT